MNPTATFLQTAAGHKLIACLNNISEGLRGISEVVHEGFPGLPMEYMPYGTSTSMHAAPGALAYNSNPASMSVAPVVIPQSIAPQNISHDQKSNNTTNTNNNNDNNNNSNKKKEKKKKDPNLPKMPASGYLLFFSEKRKEVKESHPEFLQKDVATELGRQWKALTEEQKKPYNDQYKIAMEEYKRELEAYKAAQAHNLSHDNIPTASPSRALSPSTNSDEENEGETMYPDLKRKTQPHAANEKKRSKQNHQQQQPQNNLQQLHLLPQYQNNHFLQQPQFSQSQFNQQHQPSSNLQSNLHHQMTGLMPKSDSKKDKKKHRQHISQSVSAV